MPALNRYFPAIFIAPKKPFWFLIEFVILPLGSAPENSLFLSFYFSFPVSNCKSPQNADPTSLQNWSNEKVRPCEARALIFKIRFSFPWNCFSDGFLASSI